MAAASEPALGSVSAKQLSRSPEAMAGKYFFFCSSLPKCTMPIVPIPMLPLMYMG